MSPKIIRVDPTFKLLTFLLGLLFLLYFTSFLSASPASLPLSRKLSLFTALDNTFEPGASIWLASEIAALRTQESSAGLADATTAASAAADPVQPTAWVPRGSRKLLLPRGAKSLLSQPTDSQIPKPSITSAALRKLFLGVPPSVDSDRETVPRETIENMPRGGSPLVDMPELSGAQLGDQRAPGCGGANRTWAPKGLAWMFNLGFGLDASGIGAFSVLQTGDAEESFPMPGKGFPGLKAGVWRKMLLSGSVTE